MVGHRNYECSNTSLWGGWQMCEKWLQRH
jgi:hypothetical protein